MTLLAKKRFTERKKHLILQNFVVTKVYFLIYSRNHLYQDVIPYGTDGVPTGGRFVIPFHGANDHVNRRCPDLCYRNQYSDFVVLFHGLQTVVMHENRFGFRWHSNLYE